MARRETVSRPARLLRGWAAAGVSTLCAATSHYAVAPASPDPVLLVLAFTLAGVVCVLLAGRRLGAWRTAWAVLLSQAPFHLLFSAGGHGAGAAPPGAGGLQGHHGHAPAAQALADQGAGQLSSTSDHSMLWAHVAAAAVTFVLVRHVEDGWWRFVRAAVRVLLPAVRLLAPALVPCPALRPVPQAYLLPPRGWSPARVISRRGPPAPLA